jgi:hypothetical protein
VLNKAWYWETASDLPLQISHPVGSCSPAKRDIKPGEEKETVPVVVMGVGSETSPCPAVTDLTVPSPKNCLICRTETCLVTPDWTHGKNESSVGGWANSDVRKSVILKIAMLRLYKIFEDKTWRHIIVRKSGICAG